MSKNNNSLIGPPIDPSFYAELEKKKPHEVVTRDAEPHSVEISRNAKGDPVFTVKVYAEDEKDAADRAAAQYERLVKRFPMKT